VLVVEHNLEVIKTADWVIDLGPEGGDQGGEIVAVGTPEQIAAEQESYTGQALATVIGSDRASRRPPQLPAARQRRRAVTQIRVRGASQHNLKEIDVAIPRDQLTVLCGPSGSGKSSLAMDTIYAEGQRRYVESLSAYARQFVSQMQKPRVEHIEGLSPAIAIQQRNTAQTPRSTVGTVTEIYDYLRILFARLGTPYCPECDVAVGTQSADEIIDKIMAEPAGTRLEILAPRHIDAGQTYRTLWNEIRAAGYVRAGRRARHRPAPKTCRAGRGRSRDDPSGPSRADCRGGRGGTGHWWRRAASGLSPSDRSRTILAGADP